MKKLIIFGTGDIAQIANFYFEKDSEYKVDSFVVDGEYIKESYFEGLPVIPFEEIEKTKSPDLYSLFIALSYSKMNKVREEKYNIVKKMGYQTPSYISSKCTFLSQYPTGDNCFVFEDNTIQPFVRIGNNVTIWSGNHIGHHSNIESHNFISSHVVISGHCEIKSNCFLGVNATIGHGVTIARETLVGAGAVITKNTDEKGVYVSPKPIKITKSSDQISL